MNRFLLGVLIVVVCMVGIAAVPVRVIDVSANQAEINTQIAPKLLRLKQLADGFLPRWQSMSQRQRVKLIKSGKAPLIKTMHQFYSYLDENWFGEEARSERD